MVPTTVFLLKHKKILLSQLKTAYCTVSKCHSECRNRGSEEPAISYHEDETNKCIWMCKNVTHYEHSKPPTCTCFSHYCGHPQGGVNTKDVLQKLQKLMHKYKKWSFKMYGL